MADRRGFRFGVQVTTARDGADWSVLARKAEDLGYSTLLVPDHLGHQFAPIPAMMAAASATSVLRVGTLVLDNDFRHPAVLAKELATVDVLSGGRTEIGLGAGWMLTDYEQSGIDYDRVAVRLNRFEESVAVLKGLMADGEFSFAGRHYTVTGLDGMPKPLQRPHPPLLIGGGGKQMLTIAARHADIIGINPVMRSAGRAQRMKARGAVDASTATDMRAASYDEKFGWVKSAAPERFAHLEFSSLIYFVAHGDRSSHAAHMATALGMSREDALETPAALFGSHDEMADILRARRERWGMSYFSVHSSALEAFAPVVAELAGG